MPDLLEALSEVFVGPFVEPFLAFLFDMLTFGLFDQPIQDRPLASESTCLRKDTRRAYSLNA